MKHDANTVFTAYFLSDDGTWQQPSFRVKGQESMTELVIELKAEDYFGAFTTYGFSEDEDPLDEEFIVTIRSNPRFNPNQ